MNIFKIKKIKLSENGVGVTHMSTMQQMEQEFVTVMWTNI